MDKFRGIRHIRLDLEEGIFLVRRGHHLGRETIGVEKGSRFERPNCYLYR